MNKSPSEGASFARKLVEETKAEERNNLAVLPSALAAASVAEALKGSKLRWGGQNCYFESRGPFTGENSPHVFAEMGASFCLVGHSERRQLFLEADEFLAKKVSVAQAHDLIPILCVGETLDDRKWRRTNEVIGRQLKIGLSAANPGKAVWLAYEPVWAIGTGQVATAEQVEEAHAFLSQSLTSVLGAARASETPILYGGSVKSDNAGALKALSHVSGFLVGGASLDVSEFLKIYRS